MMESDGVVIDDRVGAAVHPRPREVLGRNRRSLLHLAYVARTSFLHQ